ncbi:MAG TPA: HEAT repeat domain-containing protein [Myxococcaceae bacterium]
MTDALKELARQLSSEDPYERESAVLELAELADVRAAPLFARALADSAEPVRRWSVYGLAKLGRQEDAPALRRALEKDPAPGVRIQAALGLACMGERPALERLVQFLKAPALDTRRDAAEALLRLPEPASLKPLLQPLLTSTELRSRAWGAGLLTALGEPEAYAKWRGTVVAPESRRDAVGVVPFMKEPRAVRELLRLLGELSQEELDASEGDEPSLAEHMANALRMVGLELVLGGTADESLRADLLLLLGRHQYLIPEFIEDVLQCLGQLPPLELGRELAAVLFEQEREERGVLFMSITTLSPGLAVPTLEAMGHRDREEVLDAVVAALERAQGEDSALQALGEMLSESVYGERFEGLLQEAGTQEQVIPALSEDGEEDPVATHVTIEMPLVSPVSSTVTREMEVVTEEPSLPTMEFELPEEEGEALGEDEEEWILPTSPEAEAVAQRALVVGSLLRRLTLEERLARGKDPAAREEIQRLQRWMDEEGLFSNRGFTGLELFETPPGSWPEENRQAVGWSAEELQFLLWSLKQGKLPPPEARVEAAPLLERLPLLKDPQPFLSTAERRPIEEVEAQRNRWEVVLDCARYESFARGILADPALAEGDPELDGLLDSAEAEGFDRARLEIKHGKARTAVEGLRFWMRFLTTQLQKDGLLGGKPGEDLLFQGKRLMDLDEAGLALLLGLAHGRSQALGWLMEGSGEVPGDEDEPG